MTKEIIKERKLIIFFTSIFLGLAFYITSTSDYSGWMKLLFFTLAVVFGMGTYFVYVLINSTMEIKKDEKEKKRQEAENERSKMVMKRIFEKEKEGGKK